MNGPDLRSGGRVEHCRRGWAVLVLVLTEAIPLAAGASTVGDKAAERSAEALEHYNEGNFEEAVDRYRQAQIEDPDSPELLFNVGNALYKQGDFEAAGRAFEDASSSPPLSPRSFYNLGNTLYQKEMYPKAVEAYKEAILRGFDEEAGKANLELALRMQQQQEQQQQEQQQQEQQQQEQQQQQQQQQQGEQPGESDPGESDESTGDPEQNPRQDGLREGDEEPGQEGESSPPREAPEDSGKPEGEQPFPGKMKPSEAEQLLDAFADSEQDGQRRRFRVEARAQVRDW